MVTNPSDGRSPVSRIAVAGGVLQTFAGLSVLLLPLLRTCSQRIGLPGQPPGPLECTGFPYLGHGNELGYALLALVILTGPAVVASTRLAPGLARAVCVGCAVTNFAITVVTGWSLGPFLSLGTVVLLVRASYTLRTPASS